MRKERLTYRWLWCCLIAGGVSLLSGCAADPDVEEIPSEDTGSLMLNAVTRTEGAVPLDLSEAPSIKMYAWRDTPTNPMLEGTFTYDGTTWTSEGIKIKEETQYYLYGYMPGNITGNISALSGTDYSTGANLTFPDLPAVTTDDLCVLVGVQRVETAGGITNVIEGNYSYLSGSKDKNYVNLLMAHVYASLELSFKINADYAKLRSIHLKKVTLKSSSIDKVSISVSLQAGQKMGTPVFTPTEGTTAINFLEVSGTDPEQILDKTYTTNPLKLKTLYCAPNIFGNTVTIETQYDVYDKSGHQVGNTRTAINKLKITASAMPSGTKRPLTLTVNPTYLYLLSDWDLDNPEFVASE